MDNIVIITLLIIDSFGAMGCHNYFFILDPSLSSLSSLSSRLSSLPPIHVRTKWNGIRNWWELDSARGKRPSYWCIHGDKALTIRGEWDEEIVFNEFTPSVCKWQLLSNIHCRCKCIKMWTPIWDLFMDISIRYMCKRVYLWILIRCMKLLMHRYGALFFPIFWGLYKPWIISTISLL